MVQIDIETTHPFLSLTVAPSDDCITILSSHEIQIPEISPGVYSIILDDIFTSHECIKIKGDLPDNSEISGQTTLKINAINIANNKKVGFADVIHQHPYINRGVVLYFRPETFVE